MAAVVLRCLHANGLAAGRLATPATASFVPARGKKKLAKKQKKSKKDIQREMIKAIIKKQEMEKLVQDAALRAAKSGGPRDPEMLNPARKRERPAISEVEEERRILLVKEWTRYKMERHKKDLVFLQGMMRSREKALSELKRSSLFLYQQALELNPRLFPFERVGPTHSPPIVGYLPPDEES